LGAQARSPSSPSSPRRGPGASCSGVPWQGGSTLWPRWEGGRALAVGTRRLQPHCRIRAAASGQRQGPREIASPPKGKSAVLAADHVRAKNRATSSSLPGAIPEEDKIGFDSSRPLQVPAHHRPTAWSGSAADCSTDVATPWMAKAGPEVFKRRLGRRLLDEKHSHALGRALENRKKSAHCGRVNTCSFLPSQLAAAQSRWRLACRI